VPLTKFGIHIVRKGSDKTVDKAKRNVGLETPDEE
jgi:hypothetical protein